MDPRQTHFEIFARLSPKSDWALIETARDRAEALTAAKALHEAKPGGAVRVDKEIFDPETGQSQVVTILSLGAASGDSRGRDAKTAEPPCTMPEDLSSVHGRRTIARVLAEWLERERATPLELLHRADLAEKLEGEGTMLQHAIQKTAMAQAAQYDANVQHFVKRLNDLTEKSISALLEKHRKGKLPLIGQEGFGPLADRLGEKRVFGMRAAVAGALIPATGWGDKVAILLDLAEGLEGRAVRAAGLDVIDDFLAEVLAMPSAADSLAPETDCLGDRVEAFVEMIGGKPDQLSAPAARSLALRFKAGELRGARAALIRRVLSELLRPQRLKPGAFWDEVRLSRRLADRMIAMAGQDMPPEDIAEAFVYRSGRLVQPEAVDEALADAQSACDEIERLLRLEQALAGTMAKKKLASYLRARLGGRRVEEELTRGPGKPLERAGRIAALQQAVLDGKLPAEEKAEIADTLDRMCMSVLLDARLFDMIASGPGAPLDRASALLKLAARGGLTRGRASAEAGARAQTLVRQAVREGAADETRLTAIKSLMGDIAA